ncbi:MAG: two pore domain potassium channel family protein [bacterium]|nr:two pore domain potassium channel family protein [bacterium]
MVAERIAAFVIGLGLVGLALNDVFQSVIVPRAVGRRFRPSYYLTHLLWLLWPKLAWRVHPRDNDKREDMLAVFAPFNLIMILGFWSLLLLLGYGLMLYTLRGEVRPPLESFAQALYFAGTAYFTIGFGDFVGAHGVTRLISLAAGASGLAVVSTTTAYLFAIFGSFQTREAFVVNVGARAGTPPSGVGLLAIAGYAGIVESLPDVMRDAQRWCAVVMETHLAYPTLAYFRSSHDNQSWVGTLGTLLDASTLALTTVKCNAGEARIFHNLGRHAASDLARYFGVRSTINDAGISRGEFEHACDRLESAGYELHERDRAWTRFSELRGEYAGSLNALAHFFSIPPLQWVGDRSTLDTESAHKQS